MTICAYCQQGSMFSSGTSQLCVGSHERVHKHMCAREYRIVCHLVKHRVLQHRIMFLTPWKYANRRPDDPLARVTTST